MPPKRKAARCAPRVISDRYLTKKDITQASRSRVTTRDRNRMSKCQPTEERTMQTWPQSATARLSLTSRTVIKTQILPRQIHARPWQSHLRTNPVPRPEPSNTARSATSALGPLRLRMAWLMGLPTRALNTTLVGGSGGRGVGGNTLPFPERETGSRGAGLREAYNGVAAAKPSADVFGVAERPHASG